MAGATKCFRGTLFVLAEAGGGSVSQRVGGPSRDRFTRYINEGCAVGYITSLTTNPQFPLIRLIVSIARGI